MYYIQYSSGKYTIYIYIYDSSGEYTIYSLVVVNMLYMVKYW